MIQTFVAGANLQTGEKQLTNHSARKTTAGKLKEANIELIT